MRGCEVNATIYIWRSEDKPCMGSRAQAVRLTRQALGLQSPPTGPSSVIASVSLRRIPPELPHCANLPAFTLVLFRFSSSTWKLP